jgi:hypothetical protein
MDIRQDDTVQASTGVDELEIIYLELLANGTFDALEELYADVDWEAIEDEPIGYWGSGCLRLYD